MKNLVTTLRPTCISIGHKEVECGRTYKLLGVIATTLNGPRHTLNVIVIKAAKRLDALRLLKHADVMPKDILKVYLCHVRSVLQYATKTIPL